VQLFHETPSPHIGPWSAHFSGEPSGRFVSASGGLETRQAFHLNINTSSNLRLLRFLQEFFEKGLLTSERGGRSMDGEPAIH
jgi:hypothetical protein